MVLDQLTRLLRGAQTVAIVDLQFGDTGKGKFVDLFSLWADVIVRGTGGANAGHTIVVGGKSYILHLIPSGILHDREGKLNVIGPGVACDPHVLCEELELLDALGVSSQHLRISAEALLVLPQHIILDRASEARAGNGKIGSTGRGIAPVYTDRVRRCGLTMNDLLNVDILADKVRRNLLSNRPLLVACGDAVAEAAAKAGYGDCVNTVGRLNPDAIVERYATYGARLREHIVDTDELLQRALSTGKRILLEGAQGLLLSVRYGTYPFVTSSDSSIHGLVSGAGLYKYPDRVFGLVKAPYMTRVGEGPFPSEMGGTRSAEWCRDMSRIDEQAAYPEAYINSEDDFERGIAIRHRGAEFGATTGRLRRVGALDMPLLRYAVSCTPSVELILTKLDVMSECGTIPLCERYRYDGPTLRIGETVLVTGHEVRTAFPQVEVLARCAPVIEELPGWGVPLPTACAQNQLPQSLGALVERIAECAPVRILSVGAGREETIILS